MLIGSTLTRIKAIHTLHLDRSLLRVRGQAVARLYTSGSKPCGSKFQSHLDIFRRKNGSFEVSADPTGAFEPAVAQIFNSKRSFTLSGL